MLVVATWRSSRLTVLARITASPAHRQPLIDLLPQPHDEALRIGSGVAGSPERIVPLDRTQAGEALRDPADIRGCHTPLEVRFAPRAVIVEPDAAVVHRVDEALPLEILDVAFRAWKEPAGVAERGAEVADHVSPQRQGTGAGELVHLVLLRL